MWLLAEQITLRPDVHNGCELCTNNVCECTHNICECAHDTFQNALACDVNVCIWKHDAHKMCKCNACVHMQMHPWCQCECSQTATVQLIIHDLPKPCSAQNCGWLHMLADILFVAVTDIISKHKHLFLDVNANDKLILHPNVEMNCNGCCFSMRFFGAYGNQSHCQTCSFCITTWKMLDSRTDTQSWPIQSFMVIKSTAIEFVQAQHLGLVSGEVNMILGDRMDLRNT